jgi:hypothetical protein
MMTVAQLVKKFHAFYETWRWNEFYRNHVAGCGLGWAALEQVPVAARFGPGDNSLWFQKGGTFRDYVATVSSSRTMMHWVITYLLG